MSHHIRFLRCYHHTQFKLIRGISDYSRSLEKFLLKQQTYETASSGRETYDVYNFFDRSFGYLYDDRAVVWGCLVRAQLANRTGERDYVRPGDFWYRNPEFGRAVEDSAKRGRFGAGYGKVLGKSLLNLLSTLYAISLGFAVLIKLLLNFCLPVLCL